MLRAVDIVAWIFPFFGAVLVLRDGHVLFIMAGCAFERFAGISELVGRGAQGTRDRSRSGHTYVHARRSARILRPTGE